MHVGHFKELSEAIKTCAEVVKNVGEFGGFVCAGLFFLYKWQSGYLRPNLSISLQCERKPAVDATKHDLIVRADLSKGDLGSILIHDAQAK